MNHVVISGADRNIGLEMVREFLKRGWKVFAGQFLPNLPLLADLQKEYPEQLVIVPLDVSREASVKAAAALIGEQVEHIDMIVHNAAHFGSPANPEKGIDYNTYKAPYNVNALGAMRMVYYFRPLMEGGLKRLCFTSSEAGVVSVAHRTELSSYCMSKTALNMALRLMFNQLQPMGYTFRLFHPGWVCSPDVEDAEQVRKVAEESQGKLMWGKFFPWEAAGAAVEQFVEDRECEDRLVLIDNEGAAWPF